MELPPCEINGIVTPVNGIILHEPNILSAICAMKAAHTPTVRVVWKYERGIFISAVARSNIIINTASSAISIPHSSQIEEKTMSVSAAGTL